MPMPIDLGGRTCLVTGASGELGRVIARTLAACGADVAVHCRSRITLAESVAADVRALGRRAVVVDGDVADQPQVERMRSLIEDRLAPCDVIVANAVSQYRWMPVLEQPIEDYASQFGSSVLHAVLLAKVFIPGMIARGRGGRVIGISTECMAQCAPTQSAYVAGKQGMDAVLRVLAREIGPHAITVNQVAPGWMISDRDRSAHTEEQADYARRVALQRRGCDQDVADAVAFLASERAGFITGAIIPVDGGGASLR